MKTKKYLIAFAIFGGMLFTAQAVNQYNLDEQQTAIRKDQITKRPFAG